MLSFAIWCNQLKQMIYVAVIKVTSISFSILSRIPAERLCVRGLVPLKTFWYLHGSLLQPFLQCIPVNAFMVSVGIRRWILVIKNPVVWDDAGVKLTHETLSNIIHTVFIMSFVELRNTLLLVLSLGKIIHVMILPDIVQTV